MSAADPTPEPVEDPADGSPQESLAPEGPVGPWHDLPASELWGRLVLLAAVLCGAGTGLVSLLWEADVLTATTRAGSAFLTLVLVGRLGRWLLRTLEAPADVGGAEEPPAEPSVDAAGAERDAA